MQCVFIKPIFLGLVQFSYVSFRINSSLDLSVCMSSLSIILSQFSFTLLILFKTFLSFPHKISVSVILYLFLSLWQFIGPFSLILALSLPFHPLFFLSLYSSLCLILTSTLHILFFPFPFCSPSFVLSHLSPSLPLIKSISPPPRDRQRLSLVVLSLLILMFTSINSTSKTN